MDAKKGKIVTFGKRGPVGLQIIDVLVAELEEQDQRIQALEKKLSSLKRAMLVNGRFGKRWTPQQIHELKLMARAKTTTLLIAFELERTEQSVRATGSPRLLNSTRHARIAGGIELHQGIFAMQLTCPDQDLLRFLDAPAAAGRIG